MQFRCGVLLLAIAAALSSGAAYRIEGQTRGVLVIRHQGRDVGLETYDWAESDNPLRDSMTASIRYPATRPTLELDLDLVRQGHDQATFQLTYRPRSDDPTLYYAAVLNNRITSRRIKRGGERASEHPGSGTVVLLADSVFSLYRQIPRALQARHGTLIGFFPMSSRRVPFQVERQSNGGAGAAGIYRLSGGITGEVEVGQDGELLRVTLPDLGLEAIRKPK